MKLQYASKDHDSHLPHPFPGQTPLSHLVTHLSFPAHTRSSRLIRDTKHLHCNQCCGRQQAYPSGTSQRLHGITPRHFGGLEGSWISAGWKPRKMQNFYGFGLAGLLAVRLALLPLYALRLFSHIAGRSTKTIEQLLKHPKRCTCACHICPKRIQNSKNPTLQLH